jgi:meso-butanediol dehydrogenase / (S,S)-butanediol dehydrogenase / diacetyl reductase
MTGLFNGSVALVTGAATGIGRSAALRFAAEGAKVAVVDVNAVESSETARRCCHLWTAPAPQG